MYILILPQSGNQALNTGAWDFGGHYQTAALCIYVCMQFVRWKERESFPTSYHEEDELLCLACGPSCATHSQAALGLCSGSTDATWGKLPISLSTEQKNLI